MTGTLGFFIGAITITSFAVTSWRAYNLVSQTKLRLFVTAFLLFAAAMAVWGLTALKPENTNIQPLLVISDILVATATACMAFVLLGGVRIVTALIIGILGALLITDRVYFYPPAGYVHNGLLFFNLSGGVRTAFLVAFVLIWLPAMLSVAGELARDKAFSGMQHALNACFILLILVSALFVCARRSSTIITEFAMIDALFLAMALVNGLAITLHQELAKEGAPRAATQPKRK